MGIFAIILVVFFQLQKYLFVQILGISLANIIFTALLAAFFVVMFRAGYRAFRGKNNENLANHESPENINIFESQNFSEEQKIQILSSFLPIIGIFTTQKNSFSEMQI